ncbi:TIGR03905 family TSCPD domain-containing protein [Gallalistipes aquisgranensis]|uniref:TIGR03905 family TSCPD domain-containing protein n=1 Tax=Gallalistipes aquisgranensis TaxID=2779358 RepID=UPI001CF848CC|nr:TIGR03905 family TSCPD domain-containing protein [Gallalistipes aquisgranensis]MBE5033167.1 TIGR03905 family TSCPD domain-containing protein [Gallalistipes aquisgranensis]
MKKRIDYTPCGVCSRRIEIETEDGVVREVAFTGGCNGNTQGISVLVRGMKVDEVIARLRGIDCKGKGTSCPDQLARALEENR